MEFNNPENYLPVAERDPDSFRSKMFAALKTDGHANSLVIASIFFDLDTEVSRDGTITFTAGRDVMENLGEDGIERVRRATANVLGYQTTVIFDSFDSRFKK